jgi:glycosyltransferase involved in cell wall biosynthesis
MVSVLVLTKNEEKDLPGCLASVEWCDDIHVFDSFSSDRTVEIALSAGARITQRRFDNWSSHQNFGLTQIAFKYPWVFYLDADERMTPELAGSIRRAVLRPGTNVAFRVQRRDYFMGTWLKHVQATPWYTRLFRPEVVRYERLVNPVTIIAGPTATISGYLDHFPFSKGMNHWLDRHNSYSTLEAQQIAMGRDSGQSLNLLAAITSRDPSERRRHQKELFYRMPGRPLLKFFLLYFAKRGFLDGRAGFTYAVLQAFYEYIIVLKTKELTAEMNNLSGTVASPQGRARDAGQLS